VPGRHPSGFLSWSQKYIIGRVDAVAEIAKGERVEWQTPNLMPESKDLMTVNAEAWKY